MIEMFALYDQDTCLRIARSVPINERWGDEVWNRITVEAREWLDERGIPYRVGRQLEPYLTQWEPGPYRAIMIEFPSETEIVAFKLTHDSCDLVYDYRGKAYFSYEYDKFASLEKPNSVVVNPSTGEFFRLKSSKARNRLDRKSVQAVVHLSTYEVCVFFDQPPLDDSQHKIIATWHDPVADQVSISYDCDYVDDFRKVISREATISDVEPFWGLTRRFKPVWLPR